MWTVHTSVCAGLHALRLPRVSGRLAQSIRASAAGPPRPPAGPRAAPPAAAAAATPGSTRLSAGRPSREARGVVLEADARHGLERLAQRRPRCPGRAAGLLRRDQPVDRARDRDAVRQGMEAGEVRDRQGAADLQVDAPVAVGLDPAAPAERDLPVRRGPRQPREEAGVRRASRTTAASGGTMSRPPPTWRKSKLTAARTRCERSGCSRHCSNTALHALCDIRQRGSRASTSAWSSPMPLRASAALTSAATRAKKASPRPASSA